MNTMNNYEYSEGIEFIGLTPKAMEADGIKTIGASDFNAKLFENGHLGSGSLEMVDFFGTAFGENGGDEDDKPKYVDLGLPSGTLWANYNIGAKTQYESGLYFAWGEISGYTKYDVLNNVRSFDENSYKYQSQNEYTKYNGYDGYFKLDKLDDASTYFFGACYRIPTYDEIKELIENTTQISEDNAIIFIKGGKELSLPKLDGYDYDELIGNGCYWTNKLEDKSSNYSSVAFDINSLETAEQSRYIGLPIIPTAFKCK